MERLVNRFPSQYHYLKQHPGVYMSPKKEPNFYFLEGPCYFSQLGLQVGGGLTKEYPEAEKRTLETLGLRDNPLPA